MLYTMLFCIYPVRAIPSCFALPGTVDSMADVCMA